MHVAANAGASSSLLDMLELHARSAPEARFVAEERVDVRPLDDLVDSHLQAAGSVFTKIDVQGYELHVLRSGPATLAGSSLVQVEMSLVPLYQDGPTYRDVLQFMDERGFALVGLEPGFAAANGLLLQADALFADNRAARSLQARGQGGA
jgi:hypothetical protein